MAGFNLHVGVVVMERPPWLGRGGRVVTELGPFPWVQPPQGRRPHRFRPGHDHQLPRRRKGHTPVLTWDVACPTCGVPARGGPCLGPSGIERLKFHVARTRAASAAEAARRRKAALEDGAP